MNIRHGLVVLAVGLAFTGNAGSAFAQTASGSNASAYRMAYQSAMKCFVANGVIAGDQRREGDTVKAAIYEQKAKEAFELAFRAGRMVGLSDARIRTDIDQAQTRELPLMMRDDAYFRRAAGECRALGLM